MKILVTGSNGLLGQKLITVLDDDPTVALVATAREKPVCSLSRGNFLMLDVSDREAVNSVIARTRPDVIINTAAMTQVDQCEQNQEACWNANVASVENLLEACHHHQVHLVHVSTDFIFDGTQQLLDETAVPNPVNFYGKSKLAAEQRIQAGPVPSCILRTVLVYGVTQDLSRSNIVLWVKKNLEQGKTIHVVNDQWRTPTLAEDLAAGCLLAAKKRATGIYNICGKDYLSVYEVAVRTAAYFRLDPSLVRETDSTTFSQPAARPMRTGLVVDKARHELGYEPHSFEDGLRILAGQLPA
jgi:dTDP-4-dehydrorhamnose reductase